MSSNQEISYIVGEEKRLQDLVGNAEVMPLLASAVEAGAVGAALRRRGVRGRFTESGTGK